MPWSQEHKPATRRRIVEAAAAAFRARGLDGIGVADIMKRAGLTHGGFYAHFGSKEELAAEALAEAASQGRARLEGAAASAAPGGELLAIAEAYLSPSHCEHPERGCPLAALGSELARADDAARAAASAAIRSHIAWLAAHAPGAGARQAVGAFAAMIGGVILARGMNDPREAEQILADVRKFVRQALEPSPSPMRRRRQTSTSPR